ncbi:malate dehydrogenase [Paenibacillus dendritiformis]|uniref:Malate dehydrogenase n=1 Tax=Paenibacillus dendritiformis C454 TaxID=1131935 RepID=H3SL21_9BACL|nr:malate dehydrogenase [Paenibacillus dendritiformis]EHQ60233.1 malate dehydrogenase [Paenibacillus dendritiformis C454]CAH8771712.1 malate dehydrogenase [Paenibacillus dendritiformis]
MKRAKITIAGSGNVGATIAHLTVLKGLGDVVLYDIMTEAAQGKALDLQESGPVEGFDCLVVGTSQPSDTANSDIIIVTAGMARKPGMSRDDLLDTNVNIVKQVVREITPYSPHALLIVVTNPSDVMAQVALQESGYAPEKVIGLGGVLDSTRMRSFIALELGISCEDVGALVLGGHGDGMVPLIRYSQAGGVPVEKLLDPETLESIVERTRHGGAEIVHLLKTGSAYYAPASSVVAMMEAVLKDKKAVMPVSAYVKGEYGIADLFVGVPVILGRFGVEKIVELDLLPQERQDLMNSAEAVRKGFGQA